MTSYIGASPETTIARVRYLYTAVTAQDTFTTAIDGQVLSYESTENVDVFVNGVLLVPTTDYAAETGSSIVLVEAADADDKVEVLTYESFQAANYLPTTGGTITGDLTVDTNTLYVDSTNNRVGIGTSSPATYGVDNAEDLVIGQGDGNHGITISSFNTSNGTIAFSDTTNATVGRGFVDYDHNVDAMSFGTLATERLRIESNGNLQHLSKPAYFARAWVNFNGTGTVAIRNSGNVSSITDYGTGYYGVNFSTAMTNANYAPVAMGKPTTSSYGQSFTTNTHQSHTQTASQVRIVNSYQDDNNNSVTYRDSAYMFLAVFR